MFVATARDAHTGEPMATVEATGRLTIGELERLFLAKDREERRSSGRLLAFEFHRRYPMFVVSARNALTGELVASVGVSCDQTVGTLQRLICEEAGRDPDDFAIVFGSDRLNIISTLAHVGINGEVDVLLVANLRPITELEDLARRLKHQSEARVTFEVQRWEGMGGDFVVASHKVDRGPGASVYMRAQSIQIELRRSGGNERCTARVSAAQPVRRCVQWYLDNRPVHLEITSIQCA